MKPRNPDAGLVIATGGPHAKMSVPPLPDSGMSESGHSALAQQPGARFSRGNGFLEPDNDPAAAGQAWGSNCPLIQETRRQGL